MPEASSLLWSLALSDEGQRVLSQEVHRLSRFLGRDDLRQAGLIGLYRAAERFDPSLGFRFSTFARRWVRREMTAAIEQARNIRVPYTTIICRIRDLERLEEEHPDLTEAELARKLGVSKERFANIQAARTTTYTPLEDLIEDPPCPSLDPEQVIARHQQDRRTQADIAAALDSYPPRVQKIVRLHYGLDNGKKQTLEAISRKVGCSEERVRQLLHIALHDLRNRLERL